MKPETIEMLKRLAAKYGDMPEDTIDVMACFDDCGANAYRMGIDRGEVLLARSILEMEGEAA